MSVRSTMVATISTVSIPFASHKLLVNGVFMPSNSAITSDWELFFLSLSLCLSYLPFGVCMCVRACVRVCIFPFFCCHTISGAFLIFDFVCLRNAGPNNGKYATLSKQCKTLQANDFYWKPTVCADPRQYVIQQQQQQQQLQQHPQVSRGRHSLTYNHLITHNSSINILLTHNSAATADFFRRPRTLSTHASAKTESTAATLRTAQHLPSAATAAASAPAATANGDAHANGPASTTGPAGERPATAFVPSATNPKPLFHSSDSPFATECGDGSKDLGPAAIDARPHAHEHLFVKRIEYDVRCRYLASSTIKPKSRSHGSHPQFESHR